MKGAVTLLCWAVIIGLLSFTTTILWGQTELWSVIKLISTALPLELEIEAWALRRTLHLPMRSRWLVPLVFIFDNDMTATSSWAMLQFKLLSIHDKSGAMGTEWMKAGDVVDSRPMFTPGTEVELSLDPDSPVLRRILLLQSHANWQPQGKSYVGLVHVNTSQCDDALRCMMTSRSWLLEAVPSPPQRPSWLTELFGTSKLPSDGASQNAEASVETHRLIGRVIQSLDLIGLQAVDTSLRTEDHPRGFTDPPAPFDLFVLGSASSIRPGSLVWHIPSRKRGVVMVVDAPPDIPTISQTRAVCNSQKGSTDDDLSSAEWPTKEEDQAETFAYLVLAEDGGALIHSLDKIEIQLIEHSTVVIFCFGL